MSHKITRSLVLDKHMLMRDIDWFNLLLLLTSCIFWSKFYSHYGEFEKTRLLTQADTGVPVPTSSFSNISCYRVTCKYWLRRNHQRFIVFRILWGPIPLLNKHSTKYHQFTYSTVLWWDKANWNYTFLYKYVGRYNCWIGRNKHHQKY